MPVETLPDIDPKKYWPDTLYIIDYVFSIGDKHYFKFNDPFNIPVERALTTITFYKEVELNADRNFMLDHCEAVINCLSPTKARPHYELGEALTMVKQLQNRLNLPKDSDLMYKLASVVYFDQHENPIIYEYDYGNQKIAFWKKETTVRDFFLQKPLLELIPYLQHAGPNLETYDLLVKQINKEHSARISANLSRTPSTALKN